ncbi:12242_t:CDS:2, partial [Dentiscutata erythropus]
SKRKIDPLGPRSLPLRSMWCSLQRSTKFVFTFRPNVIIKNLPFWTKIVVAGDPIEFNFVFSERITSHSDIIFSVPTSIIFTEVKVYHTSVNKNVDFHVTPNLV